jgi:hypothetical protein
MRAPRELLHFWRQAQAERDPRAAGHRPAVHATAWDPWVTRSYRRCGASGTVARGPCAARHRVVDGAGDRRVDVLALAALAAHRGIGSVRRPPARPREHSQEPSPAADTAHGAPILAVFLGGEHGLVDSTQLHIVPLKSKSHYRASPSSATYRSCVASVRGACAQDRRPSMNRANPVQASSSRAQRAA